MAHPIEQSSIDTKTRIMRSAEAVFAEKGFHEATVSEICENAQANIAAVNYHFGTKSQLYEAVLRSSFEAARRRFPTDGGLPDTASSEKRLEAFVRAMILRAFCPSNAGAFPRFIVHEMTNPTPMIDTVLHELIHKEINVLKSIIQPLLPENISSQRRRFFGFNIMAMVMYFSFNKVARERIMASRQLTPDQVQRLIRHITLFILAGFQSATQPLDENDAVTGISGPEGAVPGEECPGKERAS